MPSPLSPTGRSPLEYLPAPLLEPGPLGLTWWQWLAIPGGLVLAAMVGKAAGYLSRRLLARLSARTATPWDDELLARLAAPLTVLWALAAAYLIAIGLGLPDGAEGSVVRVIRTATVAVFFWAGLRTVDIGFQIISDTPTARAHGLGQGLLPMLRKATKIGVAAMAVIAVLTDMGYPVASLLAGLGIGGLAVALAAQKTVENLFGSVSITVDQPFRVGDFVRLESGTVGTVEAIGLRSTRLRTLDRTLVTIPNGKLADQRLETFAARDRCRLFCALGLVHATRADQLRAVLRGIETILRAHPLVWREGISVRFVGIGASSLDVEANAWFDTADWDVFQAIREEVLLGFLEAVERAGTELAHPTQTVHLAPGGHAARATTPGEPPSGATAPRREE